MVFEYNFDFFLICSLIRIANCYRSGAVMDVASFMNNLTGGPNFQTPHGPGGTSGTGTKGTLFTIIQQIR